jgi:hypothetical protein
MRFLDDPVLLSVVLSPRCMKLCAPHDRGEIFTNCQHGLILIILLFAPLLSFETLIHKEVEIVHVVLHRLRYHSIIDFSVSTSHCN